MKQLSQKEEKLLEQYFDGESGFFARRRAKRLLGSNQAANSYLNGLHELSNNCKEAVSASFDNLMPKLDLWNKISARIDQEEYSAIFLGERTKVKEEKVPWYSGIAWAIPGAALSAFAFFMVTGQTVNDSNQQLVNPQSIFQGVNNFSPVSSVDQQIPLQPVRSVSQNSGQPIQSNLPYNVARRSLPLSGAVEVDWMRSDGRVRLIEDPEDSGAIIWIRRRNNISNSAEVLSRPIAGTRNSNGIEVIEDSVPDAFVVGADH